MPSAVVFSLSTASSSGGNQGARAKQPYAIGMKSREPFGLAAICEGWRHPEWGEVVRTFCIVTTDANELVPTSTTAWLRSYRLRPLACQHRTQPARSAGAVPGRADDDVADLDTGEQADNDDPSILEPFEPGAGSTPNLL
jgi:SOS response associated peptidase (SRAP)